MSLDERERRDFHEQPTSEADSGVTWMVIGFLLWISDVIAFLTVGFYDIRVGHHLIFGWVIFAGVVGFAMILGGWMIKRRGQARHHH